MTDLVQPATRPANPRFSSGPCAKIPTFTLDKLNDAALGRSHRAAIGKQKLKAAIETTREILGIPADYKIGIVPASDTGAVEMAMWSMLGARGVTMLAWESFGSGWVTDVAKQLKLDATVMTADYGQLPDLASVDFATDDGTHGAAEDRTKSTVATTGDFVTGQGAYAGTDDKARRAIVAAAVVTAVIATPHAVAAGDPARGDVIAAAVVNRAILGALAVCGRPARRIGRSRFSQTDAGERECAGSESEGDLFHFLYLICLLVGSLTGTVLTGSTTSD